MILPAGESRQQMIEGSAGKTVAVQVIHEPLAGWHSPSSRGLVRLWRTRANMVGPVPVCPKCKVDWYGPISCHHMGVCPMPTKEERDPLLVERQKTHGDFASNAKQLPRDQGYLHSGEGAADFNPAHREALDMIALKLSRILSGQASTSKTIDRMTLLGTTLL